MKSYAYVNAVVLDGTEHMEPQEGMDVLVQGETIAEVVPHDEGRDFRSEGYEIVDIGGRYLIPGLINMHVHLAGNGKPQKKQRDNTKLVRRIFSNPIGAAAAHALVRRYAELELMSGVTTIRTVGGLRDLDTTVRDEILSGKRRGPRILAANEGISVPGGHMAGSVAVDATSIEEALAQVRHCKETGCDLVKLMITGGVLDAKEKGVPGELKMDASMVKAVCDEAHRLGLVVAAHVESPQGVMVALENGVDSVEHGAKPSPEMVELFRSRGAFVVTTLSPALPYALFDRSISCASETEQYNGQVVFEGIRDCAKAALDNGIPVALGNDVGCPWITQYDFWRELYYFHAYVGVSNRFALYTATLRNAELAGIGDITGSIEPGKSADLLVVEGNPLDDLAALRTPWLVSARGNLVRHPSVKRNAVVDRELDKFLR